ncbi:hypothetical protein V5F49_22015 [Xanthobacter sp. V3C-3]|uniref:hypothetical protein n=1 Tax=Xanthobacter lutulentifluminis TaxID=3119935 RepID=UPI003728DEAF
MSLAAPSRLEPGRDAGEATSARSGLGTRLLVLGAVAVVGALGAAAVMLWARHGATVFFDILSAGIAACL